MARLQLALNVEDLDQAVDFYSTLLGVEPAKRRPGYVNFAVADPPLKLVLIEQAGAKGTLNHLGVEVETVEHLDAERARLAETGLLTADVGETTCCYARQDKLWIEGAPHPEPWEVYTVLDDSATFFAQPAGAQAGTEAGTVADTAGAACCADSADVDRQRAGAEKTCC